MARRSFRWRAGNLCLWRWDRTIVRVRYPLTPLVPRTSLSLWNKVQLLEQLGAGVGVVHQARMYAAVDNSVTLPAFTRVDGALFLTLNRLTRIQLNVENLFDANYFASAQGNNNIMPGAPRTFRLSLGLGR